MEQLLEYEEPTGSMVGALLITLGHPVVKRAKSTVQDAYETEDQSTLDDLWDEAVEYQEEYFDDVAEHGLYGFDGAFMKNFREDPAALLEQIGYAQGFSDLEYTPH